MDDIETSEPILVSQGMYKLGVVQDETEPAQASGRAAIGGGST
jgi:hypothetical protein